MYLIVNVDRCWGCKACQMACKWEHGLKAGDGDCIKVYRIENEEEPVKANFVPTLCIHCDSPMCETACPVKAIGRDQEGLVQVDANRCIGCGRCETACPYGLMVMRREGGRKKANKCDLCTERRSRGFLASCEQHCLGGAITSCTERQKSNLTADFSYKMEKGRVIYVSNQCVDLGYTKE